MSLESNLGSKYLKARYLPEVRITVPSRGYRLVQEPRSNPHQALGMALISASNAENTNVSSIYAYVYIYIHVYM